MKCPSCTAGLNTVIRNGVEIDICPRCRGVWLDRGELEKLLREAPDEYDNDESEERGSRYRQPPEHQQRKKGFWSNLFDFE